MSHAVPCPACGGELRPQRHAWRFRCAACGLLHADLPIAIPDYARDDDVDEAMRGIGLGGLRYDNNERLLRAVAGLRPPPGRLLDVGSGPGFLLGQATAHGYQTHGIEPDANTVDAARRGGHNVRQGYFPAVLATDEWFDVIVFNDVLEHIPDISGALTACAEHLAPGGVLCLNCPSRGGLFFRAADLLDRLGLHGPYNRLWQRGLPSPHLWYFKPPDLERAGARSGLSTIARLPLATVQLKGLWARIRCVRDAGLLSSAAAYLFAVLAWPFARLTPDAVAVLLRKAPG